MGENHVVLDLFGGVNLKIAGRQRREMRHQLVPVQRTIHKAMDLFYQQLALLFLNSQELSSARQNWERPIVQRPEQRILESIPKLLQFVLPISSFSQK